MPENSLNLEARDREPLVPYVSLIITPGLEPELIEGPARHAESLVLVTNALGSLPTNLHETVGTIISSGKPVFGVPDTVDTHLELSGELERQTAALGVTYIPGVNVTNEALLCKVIKQAVSEGLRGTELRDAVIKSFSASAK